MDSALTTEKQRNDTYFPQPVELKCISIFAWNAMLNRIKVLFCTKKTFSDSPNTDAICILRKQGRISTPMYKVHAH